MISRIRALFILLCIPHTHSLHAKELDAQLGQQAPQIYVTNWVKKVANFETVTDQKHTYVLIFWETWCDSCMASLPHLTDLQNTFRTKGVEFIGISSETAESIQAFLTNSSVGQKINFSLGCDSNHLSSESYMKAFDQERVPASFVISKAGKLIWVGHPLAGLDFVLDQEIKGRFDIKSARKSIKAEKMILQYFQAVTNHNALEDTKKIGCEIVSNAAGNPWVLNNFAWRILTDPRIPATNRDLKLSLEASKFACKKTDWSRPAFLDTYATALSLAGEQSEAIRLERLAIQLCTNNQTKARLEQTLSSFTNSSFRGK